MNKINKLVINNFLSKSYVPTKLRILFYKALGLKNLQCDVIFPGCFFEGKNISIGKGTWINRGCEFDCEFADISIGNNCGIAMQVLFCTSSHEIGNSSKRAGVTTRQPIKIGNGCWIGARATVLPGVTIGDGCIIASGAVVNKNCKPNGLYAGVPAKRIRELPTDIILSEASTALEQTAKYGD